MNNEVPNNEPNELIDYFNEQVEKAKRHTTSKVKPPPKPKLPKPKQKYNPKYYTTTTLGLQQRIKKQLNDQDRHQLNQSGLIFDIKLNKDVPNNAPETTA